MTKVFLALMLIAAQLPAGSGAELHLCVGQDGSVCVDGGPHACKRCKPKVLCACCAVAGNRSEPHCCGHQHCGVPREGWTHPAEEDGTHVKIMQPQPPGSFRRGTLKTGRGPITAVLPPSFLSCLFTLDRPPSAVTIRSSSAACAPAAVFLASIFLRC